MFQVRIYFKTCQASNLTGGSEILFLGPGDNKQIPEILSLPSFSSTNCTLPTKNSPPQISGYVATVLTNGVMICGGDPTGIAIYNYKNAFCNYILQGHLIY